MYDHLWPLSRVLVSRHDPANINATQQSSQTSVASTRMPHDAPLLELQRCRDPLRGRVLRDRRRRRLKQRVPAGQLAEVVQLLLNGRGSRESFREGQRGVGHAVDVLAGESVLLWWTPRMKDEG